MLLIIIALPTRCLQRYVGLPTWLIRWVRISPVNAENDRISLVTEMVFRNEQVQHRCQPRKGDVLFGHISNEGLVRFLKALYVQVSLMH